MSQDSQTTPPFYQGISLDIKCCSIGALERLSFEHLLQWLNYLVKVFDDIIQNNKILICNFSKGHIGEDTSTLLGISVTTKLQLAALRRSRLGQAERTPFYLYVDEFQNFATTSFVQLLSEARKYKLFLTMAEQSTAQQEERRFVDIILANVGTVICFRSGSPIDEQTLLPLFSPYVQKGEIANLSAYNFYAKLSGVKAQEPMSGETVVVAEEDADEKRAERVVAESQKRWAIMYEKPVVASKPKGTATKKNTPRKRAQEQKNESNASDGMGLLGADAPADI